MKPNFNDPALQQRSERIARAAAAIQQQQMSEATHSVRVEMAGKTITVMLTSRSSTVEQPTAPSGCGAARVQESHRELSYRPADALCSQIQQIVGLEVREILVDAEPAGAAFGQPSPADNRVRLFLLSESLPSEIFDDAYKAGSASLPGIAAALAAA